MKSTRLPTQLEAARQEIEAIARAYGLDFFPILYEVLDYRTLYETAAFGGFPTRYPHWRFGMDFDQLLKGHVWAGSTIYEMVINTNPSYAYLLEGNEDVTQKMVMAHVTGHVDFFKHNMWFAHTNRKMLDAMANHATRIQRIIDRVGYDLVESFIDTCLSLENLIDYHSPYIRRPEAQSHRPIVGEDEPDVVEGLKVDREYMRGYINPPEYLEDQRKKLDAERAKQRRFPENPQRDVLLFLMNYAPLERWQHTVLEIVRDEAYYFAPQGMTKILNEGWACLTGTALLFTEEGLLPLAEVVQRQLSLRTADGSHPQRIYDWATFANYATIKLTTSRGFQLEGSVNHRVLLADGTWRRLDQLQPGDQVQLAGGQDLWASTYVPLSPASPAVLDEPLAALLGYLAGHNLQLQRSSIDEADDEPLFAAPNHPRWQTPPTTLVAPLTVTTRDAVCVQTLLSYAAQCPDVGFVTHDDGEQWQIVLEGGEAAPALHQVLAAQVIPDSVMRSPKPVVASFLRGLYDANGDVATQGAVLFTREATFSQHVQLLLLNVGILSSNQQQPDGTWQISIAGAALRTFADQIGFDQPAKRQALQKNLASQPTLAPAPWTDSVVALAHGRADVYDISVEVTHRYAAQGLINHNSYWHSTIMTQHVADASEIISFADLHSGVVATSGGRLNPYKVGLELLRDIEDRWNKGKFGKEYDECDDLATKRTWDRGLGLGRQKIFEIRKLYNDVTFIDEFLTPEFVIENKLFTFRYNRDTDLYEIASREFREIKEKLLFRLTNFGQPSIMVEDGNYNNRGELYLRHRHEGVDLKMDYARDTMRNLHRIWTRPIHLETIIDDKKRLLSFDGSDFTERRID
ncbi:SpoVR family protein [Candidatus Chloroploca asiatica]|uniref:SpoVR family protein n=1 Tax=Candidatus Chloroploca asiatica TaxID=1506545 RepID=UPI001FEB2EC9|nr:SpoVR family protein [Candidatus Chloroploca asiatica]